MKLIKYYKHSKMSQSGKLQPMTTFKTDTMWQYSLSSHINTSFIQVLKHQSRMSNLLFSDSAIF